VQAENNMKQLVTAGTKMKATSSYLHFVFPLMTMPSKFAAFLPIFTRQLPLLPSTLINFLPVSILCSRAMAEKILYLFGS
jgi:hypothetical protein